MKLTFALAGNPNSGKTTLFNELTGSKAHVGNWPGVTVEKKMGQYKGKLNTDGITIVDLPGIYSLSPYSPEEKVSRDFLLDDEVDVIINIVDASNIERNLYLTSQLMETEIPVVIALNMMDIVESHGDTINMVDLSHALGVPVVPIVAAKGKGIKEMMSLAVNEAIHGKHHYEYHEQREILAETVLEETELYPLIEELTKLLSNKESNPLFKAIKLLENDNLIYDQLKISAADKKQVDDIINRMKEKYGDDYDAIIADFRYQSITAIIQKFVKHTWSFGALSVSDKIDKVLTNRFLAIPIFITMMGLVFWFTFGATGPGIWLKEGMETILLWFSAGVEVFLDFFGASSLVSSLVLDGMISGVGAVLTFLPQIVLLFLCISLFEDTGYMARVAFIMDLLLKRFGLSGKSCIPLIMGFGCTVPALMACRTLENEKDRKMTMMLTPFMSCGAKMPIYVLLIGIFFGNNKTLVMLSIYVLGIAVAIFSGIILKKTVLKGESLAFIMELPAYRLPKPKFLFVHVWEKAKGFLIRAGTILLAASIVIWFLQTFNFSLDIVEDSSKSILGSIGKLITPIFIPCGFADWRISVSLLTGLVAKEAVVSTLGILFSSGAGAIAGLEAAIHSTLNSLAAYSFMAFCLLYMPCIASFAAMRKEFASWKWTFGAIAFQTGIAWIVSTLIFKIGSLFI